LSFPVMTLPIKPAAPVTTIITFIWFVEDITFILKTNIVENSNNAKLLMANRNTSNL